MKKFNPFSDKQKELQKLLANKDGTDFLSAGGARSGKTFILIRALITRALKEPNSNHAILRRYFSDVKLKIGMVSLPDVLEKCFSNVPYELNKANWVLTLPNNSRIWLGGLDDNSRAEKILGAEYSTIFIDEISQVSLHSVEIARTRLAEKNKLRKVMYFATNPPLKTHWSYIDFVEKPKKGHYYLILNPIDNLNNIDKNFIERLKELPEREKQRFLYGQWQDLREGALFKYSWIEKNRVEKEPEEFDDIIVAVDPAVTSSESADETGIVVLASSKNQYYVLGDFSTKDTPASWAKIVADIYERFSCSKVIVESNQGGEMTGTIINQINNSIRVKTVFAHKNKLTRAEPVATVYERNLVHHVGEYPELESELITYEGKSNEQSPNRMDALVHGLTFLGNLGKRIISPSFSTETYEKEGEVNKNVELEKEINDLDEELEDENNWTQLV